MRKACELTSSEEPFVCNIDLDRSLLALRIAMARRQETPRNKLVHPSLIRIEVTGGSSGMDGRMRLIVLRSITRALKLAIDQPNMSDIPVASNVDSLCCEASPVSIDRLLLYQRHEVERLVVLVRLGTRVAQKSLLI